MTVEETEETQTRNTRSHALPLVAWWCSVAAARMTAIGWSSRRLASELTERTGLDANQSSVTRCLSGAVMTIEMSVAISAVLGIPPPVFIPTSEAEAIAFVSAREIHRVKAQVAVLKAGVDARAPGDQAGVRPFADVIPRRQRRPKPRRS